MYSVMVKPYVTSRKVTGSRPSEVNKVLNLPNPSVILNISEPYRPPRPVNGDSFTAWKRSVLPVRYELDCKYCFK
jgi:aspartate carbamoyltransferase regulatory subunit